MKKMKLPYVKQIALILTNQVSRYTFGIISHLVWSLSLACFVKPRVGIELKECKHKEKEFQVI